MSSNSLLGTAHKMIRNHLKPGAIAIDATVGNGHDTVFLAQQVGASGTVYGFDIQQNAINKTVLRLAQENLTERTNLYNVSHVQMLVHIPAPLIGKVDAIVFNLGYLPGGDKTLITRSDSTIQALTLACQLLSANGIISLLVYPGHAGGDQECQDIQQWLEQLNPQLWRYQTYFSQHHHDQAPRLILLNRQAICYDARPINLSTQVTMSEFNNVTIVKKANVYFDGNVSSRTILFADGSKKTLGFMLPGEYTFNTGAPEIMEILAGELDVLLPEADWQTIKGGEAFNVPANASFTMRVKSPSDYCCSFLA